MVTASEAASYSKSRAVASVGDVNDDKGLVYERHRLRGDLVLARQKLEKSAGRST